MNGHPVGEALKVDGRWRFEADTGRVFVESRRADLAPHARRARQALIDAGEG